MATLNKISEYTLKGVTMPLTPGAAGSVIVSINFEGSAIGRFYETFQSRDLKALRDLATNEFVPANDFTVQALPPVNM